MAASLAEAIDGCADATRVFVIGGEQLYRTALPLADTLILTVIGRDYDGDAFFPDFSDLPLVCVNRRVLSADLPLTIETYRKRSSGPT